MKKIRMAGWGLLAWLCLAGLLHAQTVVTVSNLATMDSNNTYRTTFSKGENITFQVNGYYNAVTYCASIGFAFTIQDPNARTVLSQQGNSVRGNLGYSGPVGASLSNFPTNSFFTVSGTYTFTGKASAYHVLDNAVMTTVNQTMTFNITSPQVSLSYPFNGAQNLADNPLIFSWSASGAVQYEVQVDISQGFSQPVWQSIVSTTSATYPLNPRPTSN